MPKLAWGWNPKSDPVWAYRKTLNKKEREEFDKLDSTEQVLRVLTIQQQSG